MVVILLYWDFVESINIVELHTVQIKNVKNVPRFSLRIIDTDRNCSAFFSLGSIIPSKMLDCFVACSR